MRTRSIVTLAPSATCPPCAWLVSPSRRGRSCERGLTMGLTIHWTLDAGDIPVAQARAKVRQLYDIARRLPFQRVWPIDDLRGDACDYDKNPDEDLQWLPIQARHTVFVERPDGRYSVVVMPRAVIAFTADPGDGSETASFGLCRYPKTIMFKGTRIPTGVDGWHWHSFCKTQYASDPAHGGTQNFLKCHLVVIALLRHAEEMGLVTEVYDEGDYWDKGDVRALAQEVGEWNTMIAGFAGLLKDALSDTSVTLEAPILSRQDFEHLEAQARATA